MGMCSVCLSVWTTALYLFEGSAPLLPMSAHPVCRFVKKLTLTIYPHVLARAGCEIQADWFRNEDVTHVGSLNFSPGFFSRLLLESSAERACA